MDKKNQSLYESFNNAINGLIEAVKSERNMRTHLITAVLVLLLGMILDLSRTELMILFFTISLVISLELVNTAIEKTIDLITKEYHPLARKAKDIAAAAVFMAALNAVAIGWFLFGQRLINITRSPLRQVINTHPADLIVVGLAVCFVIVIFLKGASGAKTPLKGGWPSGHATLAFGIATAIFFYSESLLVSVLGYVLAFLVAQSRVEGDIHNNLEVVAGAALGVLIMALVVLIQSIWLA